MVTKVANKAGRRDKKVAKKFSFVVFCLFAEIVPDSSITQSNRPMDEQKSVQGEQTGKNLEESGDMEKNEGVEAAEEPPTKKQKRKTTKDNQAAEFDGEKNTLYPYAKIRGIRIFSEREINAQDAEMTRQYWTFWNTTAEDLCSDRAYNDWCKRDLKLYIDAAWVAYKSQLQEAQVKQVQESVRDLQQRYGHGELPAKLKTEDENVTELLAQSQDSTANLSELNTELSRARGKLLNLKQRAVSTSFSKDQKGEEVQEMSKTITEKEKNLYNGMADVKKDQDSLKKALSRLNNSIIKAKRNCPQLPTEIIINAPLATIETTIIHQM